MESDPSFPANVYARFLNILFRNITQSHFWLLNTYNNVDNHVVVFVYIVIPYTFNPWTLFVEAHSAVGMVLTLNEASATIRWVLKHWVFENY